MNRRIGGGGSKRRFKGKYDKGSVEERVARKVRMEV